MPIRDMSEYVFDGTAFVLKEKNKLKKGFFVVSVVLAGILFSPTKYIPVEIDYIPQEHVLELEEPKNGIENVVNYILKINPTVSEGDAKEIVKSAFIYGSKFGVDPATLLALAKVESTFDKHAISGVGAMGILQVMPRWHHDKFKAARKEIGNPEVFAIETNFFVGAQVFKDCTKKFQSIKSALLCYNGSNNDPESRYHIKVLDAKKEIKPLLKGIEL